MTDVVLESVPALAGLYRDAALGEVRRRAGLVGAARRNPGGPGPAAALPPVRHRVDGVAVDRDRLTAFQHLIGQAARDAVPSVQLDPRLPVIPVRALKNKETERFTAKQREIAEHLDGKKLEMAEAQLQIEHYWAGALRRAVIDGDVETGSVMAGQSVGMVTREEPTADIIRELVDEAAAALARRG